MNVPDAAEFMNARGLLNVNGSINLLDTSERLKALEESLDKSQRFGDDLAARYSIDIGQNYYEDVRKFHLLFHNPPKTPTVLSSEKWEHRIRLILEELSETSTAQAMNDFPGFADGLVDLTWVVLGTAVEAGLPFNEIWKEVRRTNMDKKGGELDTSGKLLKPPGWTPPDIEAILHQAQVDAL